MQKLPDYGCKCPHYQNETKCLMHSQWQKMPMCPPDFTFHCCTKRRIPCLRHGVPAATIEVEHQIERDRLRNSRGGFIPPSDEKDMVDQCHYCDKVLGCYMMTKIDPPFLDVAVHENKTHWACRGCYKEHHSQVETIDPKVLKLAWPPKPNQGSKRGELQFKTLANRKKKANIKKYKPVRIFGEQALRVPELVNNTDKLMPRDSGKEKERFQCHNCTLLYPARCISGDVSVGRLSEPSLQKFVSAYECWNCYYLRMSAVEFKEVQKLRKAEALLRLADQCEIIVQSSAAKELRERANKTLVTILEEEEEEGEKEPPEPVGRPPSPMPAPASSLMEEDLRKLWDNSVFGEMLETTTPTEDLTEWLDSLVVEGSLDSSSGSGAEQDVGQFMFE